MPVMTKAQYEEWVKRVNSRNKIIKSEAPKKEEPKAAPAPKKEEPKAAPAPQSKPAPKPEAVKPAPKKEKPNAAPKKVAKKSSKKAKK